VRSVTSWCDLCRPGAICVVLVRSVSSWCDLWRPDAICVVLVRSVSSCVLCRPGAICVILVRSVSSWCDLCRPGAICVVTIWLNYIMERRDIVAVSVAQFQSLLYVWGMHYVTVCHVAMTVPVLLCWVNQPNLHMYYTMIKTMTIQFQVCVSSTWYYHIYHILATIIRIMYVLHNLT
jgi:hypothetical protein